MIFALSICDYLKYEENTNQFKIKSNQLNIPMIFLFIKSKIDLTNNLVNLKLMMNNLTNYLLTQHIIINYHEINSFPLVNYENMSNIIKQYSDNQIQKDNISQLIIIHCYDNQDEIECTQWNLMYQCLLNYDIRGNKKITSTSNMDIGTPTYNQLTGCLKALHCNMQNFNVNFVPEVKKKIDEEKNGNVENDEKKEENMTITKKRRRKYEMDDIWNK